MLLYCLCALLVSSLTKSEGLSLNISLDGGVNETEVLEVIFANGGFQNETGLNNTTNSSKQATDPRDDENYQEIIVFLRNMEIYVLKYYNPFMIVLGGFGCVVTIIVFQKGALPSSASVYIRAIAWANMFVIINFTVLMISTYESIAKTAGWRNFYTYYVVCLYNFDFIFMAANTWTIIAFSVERLLAITYPLKAHVICNQGNAKKIVIAIFVFAFIFKLPRFFTKAIRITTDPVTNETLHVYYSTELGTNALFTQIDYLLFAFADVIIPVPMVAVLNVVIILTLRRIRTKQHTLKEGNTDSGETTNVQIERVLVASMSAYFICNVLTATIFLSIAIHGRNIFRAGSIEFRIRWILSSVVYIMNPFLNFIVYVVCSPVLRSAVIDLLHIRKWFPSKDSEEIRNGKTKTTNVESN